MADASSLHPRRSHRATVSPGDGTALVPAARRLGASELRPSSVCRLFGCGVMSSFASVGESPKASLVPVGRGHRRGSLVERFREVVGALPAMPALVSAGQSVTFEQVECRSDAVASVVLARLGSGAEPSETDAISSPNASPSKAEVGAGPRRRARSRSVRCGLENRFGPFRSDEGSNPSPSAHWPDCAAVRRFLAQGRGLPDVTGRPFVAASERC
jgi:hypothetical protein